MTPCTNCDGLGTITLHEPEGDVQAPCPFCQPSAAREWARRYEPVEVAP